MGSEKVNLSTVFSTAPRHKNMGYVQVEVKVHTLVLALIGGEWIAF
jgi:hypothetical protein